MATHSSILAWKSPRTEKPGPWGRVESKMTEQLTHKNWVLRWEEPRTTI